MPRCTCQGQECTTEEFYEAYEEYDPYSSNEQWESAETCSIGCHSPPRPEMSPPRRYVETTPPGAPFRELTRRPDLRSGMAIARRRLDFDTISSLEYEDDAGTLDLFQVSGAPQPADDFQRRGFAHSTAIPGPGRRPRFQPPSAPIPPRMTRQTACGKCLRM